jgi:hypothetical protein
MTSRSQQLIEQLDRDFGARPWLYPMGPRMAACGVPLATEPEERWPIDDGCGWGDYCPNGERFVVDQLAGPGPVPQWRPLPGECNACFLYDHAHCESPLGCTCKACNPTNHPRGLHP